MAYEQAESVVNLLEAEEEEPKFQFLKSRTKTSVDNGYHPTHNKSALADIPDLETGGITVANEDQDREQPEIIPSKYQLTDEDAAVLKQRITHLTFDAILKIFAFYHHNVEITIAAAQQMRAPELVPVTVQDMYVANIPIERFENPTKKSLYKDFYLSNQFRKVCNPKTLVNFYYKEKNKFDGNWRLEQELLQPMTSEERIALGRKMTASKIGIAGRDLWAVPGKKKQKKSKKNPVQTRTESSVSISKERIDDMDSDSASNASISDQKIFETFSTGTSLSKDDEISRSGVVAETQPFEESMDTTEPVTNVAIATSPLPEIITETPIAICTTAPSPISIVNTTVKTQKSVSTLNIGTSPIPEDSQVGRSKEERNTSTPSPPISPSLADPLSTPEPKSSSSSSSGTTTSSESSTICMKIRFSAHCGDILNYKREDSSVSPSFPSTSSQFSSVRSVSESEKTKKKYRKKTIEELRGGAQKIYPERDRKAKKFFEDED